MRDTSEIPIASLPEWMRRSRRGVDWGLLLSLALSFLVSLPVILRTELPQTTAIESYAFLVNDYAQSMLEGVLLPRWSATTNLGYGSPLPMFFPPGAPWTGAFIQVLFTDNPLTALRVLLSLAFLLSGGAAYTLVANRTHARAGVLTSALYLASPYIALTGPHLIGDLAGVLALALLPAQLAAVDALYRRSAASIRLLTVLTTAALALTHPLVAGASTVLCVLLGLWSHSAVTWRARGRVLLAWSLGMALGAFFWLPAILEHGAVPWLVAEPLSRVPITLESLLIPVRWPEMNEMRPPPQWSLGTLTLLLAAIGGAAAMVRKQVSLTAWGLAAAIGSIVMILGAPQQSWFIGIAGLGLAVAASSLVTNIPWPGRSKRLVLPSLLILLWLTALPVWNTPPVRMPIREVSAQAQIRYETSGFGSAIAVPGWPQPSPSTAMLPPNRALLDSIEQGQVNKLAPGSTSLTFQANPLEHTTHRERIQIRQSTQPATVRILTTYFPGWTATLDGRPLPLRPTPEGLIEVDIPIVGVGASELWLTLQDTDARRLGWGISLLAFVGALLFVLRRAPPTPMSDAEPGRLTLSEARLTALPIACFVLVGLLTTTEISPSLVPVLPAFPPDMVTIDSRTDAGMRLLGMTLDRTLLDPGQTALLTLYWQAQRFLNENYYVSLTLTRITDGLRLPITSARHPGNWPTRRWNTQQVLRDSYSIQLPPEVIGQFQLRLALNSCDPDCMAASPLIFYSANGSRIGPVFTLPSLITAPQG